MNETTMIETITVEETTQLLRKLGMKISNTTIYRGIQQRVFPWGDYIQGEKGPIYFVYRVMLDDWIADRTMGRKVMA